MSFAPRSRLAMPSRLRPFRPLGLQLLGWQVGICLLAGLLVLALQLILLLGPEHEALQEDLHAALLRHGPARRIPPAQGEALVPGILQWQVGKQILAIELMSAPPRQERFRLLPQRVCIPAEPILPGQWLCTERTVVLSRLGGHALALLPAHALGIALIAILMTGVYRRLLGQPLAALLQHLQEGTAASASAARRPSRPPSAWTDEFDLIFNAVHDLQGRHAAHLAAQRRLEEELRAHRDTLAGLVALRTRSLERLRDFHALLIRVLTHFMNLPGDQAGSGIEQALAAFCQFFDAPRCLLLSAGDDGCGVQIAYAWPALPASQRSRIWLSADDSAQENRGARSARLWLDAGAEHPGEHGQVHRLDPDAAQACTIVGVRVMNRTVGLLCLVGRVFPPEGEHAHLLELGARVAASMLDHREAQGRLITTQVELERANRELHQLSRYDPLTGLPNRRRFDEVKAIEFARALRTQQALSVLMCDIDHFKAYNDTYGHAQGDRCLQAVASSLAALFTRAGELPARMGGEEFAVLLPGASEEQAHAAAERLRQAVWDLRLPHARSSVAERVTLSIGVASLVPGRHADFDSLLQEADRALYAAKRQRNQVCVAG